MVYGSWRLQVSYIDPLAATAIFSSPLASIVSQFSADSRRSTNTLKPAPLPRMRLHMGNVIPKATIFRRSTSKSRPADKQCRNTLALWTKSASSIVGSARFWLLSFFRRPAIFSRSPFSSTSSHAWLSRPYCVSDLPVHGEFQLRHHRDRQLLEGRNQAVIRNEEAPRDRRTDGSSSIVFGER